MWHQHSPYLLSMPVFLIYRQFPSVALEQETRLWKMLTEEICKWISTTKEFPEDILWITECEAATEVITIIIMSCKRDTTVN